MNTKQMGPAYDPQEIFRASAVYGMANYLVAFKGLQVKGEEGKLFVYEVQEAENPKNNELRTKQYLVDALSKRLFSLDINLPSYLTSPALNTVCDAVSLTALQPEVWTHWFVRDFADWNTSYDQAASQFMGAFEGIFPDAGDYKAFVTTSPLNMAHFPDWLDTVQATFDLMMAKVRIMHMRQLDHNDEYLTMEASLVTQMVLSFAELVQLWTQRLKESGI